MANSIIGIKQLGMCDLGTLATTKTNPLVMGFSKAINFEAAPFQTEKDRRDRELRNRINLKSEFEMLQPTMKALKQIIGWLNGNCDIQVITNKQSSSATSDDILKFIGENLMGLNFEYTITNQKRSLKLILERAFEYEAYTALIDGADSEVAVVLGAGEGIDVTAYRAPRFGAFEYPSGTPIFASRFDRVDYSFTIKGKVASKNEDNMDVVHYLSVLAKITGNEASITKIVAELNKAMTAAAKFKFLNAGTCFDEYQVAAGVLALKTPHIIGDEKRIVTAELGGDVPIHDVSFQFSEAYGGTIDDNGALGGTMVIG